MEVPSYEISKDDVQGRYMKACRNIAAGSLILKEAPLVVGPQERGIIICFCCNRILNSIKVAVCPGCKTASVCSESCKGSWHNKNECEFLSNCSVQCGHILVDSRIIMPVRCLILRFTDAEKWLELMKLESHVEKRRNSDLWRDVAINIESLFLSNNLISQEDVKEELVQKICGILDVNTFEIRANDAMNVNCSGFPVSLRGLYLKTSLINHDCIGNTHVAMDDNLNLIVHSSMDIAEGGIIYFNYSNPLKGNQERRMLLKQGKYFECKCRRCSDASELGTNISSLKCPRCKHGFVRKEELVSTSSWACSLCQRIFSQHLIYTTVAEAKSQINSLNGSSIYDAEKLLQKLLKTFTDNHFLILELKQTLVGLYTQNAPKEKNLVQKIRLCEELLSVFEVIEPGLSRMQGITLYELQNAKVLLTLKQMNERLIKPECFIGQLEEAESILKRSIKHLLYEPKCSPEGTLCLKGLQELKNIRNLIMEQTLHSTSTTNGVKRLRTQKNRNENSK